MKIPMLSRPAPSAPAAAEDLTPAQVRARLAQLDRDRVAKREQLRRAQAPLQAECDRLRAELAAVEQDVARLEGQQRDWELAAVLAAGLGGARACGFGGGD